ncbi:MAG: phosphoribosylformylglycinamidine synthase [Euryarchaeota archaeon]|nr:phosphoribosylformylglycinamidine synthase [Euryarchaeota archaeon]|tara:strand:- start:754 stop:1590 length:837 start_codon:yes stop_codon:yes gene_type:complete
MEVHKMSVKVAILTGFGINCDRETAAVFEMAGAKSERIHVNKLVNGEIDLQDYHIMAVPGGFSFGDHLGSGRLMGNRLRFGLREQVRKFVNDKKPIIGICNGFQVLVKMGLLPGDDDISFEQTASLTLNDSGHYEDRWVTLEFEKDSHCIWTKGLTRMRVPVRHGEGKFVTNNKKLLDKWNENGQLVVRYVDPNQQYPSKSDELLPYPISPNSSWRNIAGVCDPTGLVFGLMPHPEANHSTWLGATWTRENLFHGQGEGMVIFHNAVNYAKSQFSIND